MHYFPGIYHICKIIEIKKRKSENDWKFDNKNQSINDAHNLNRYTAIVQLSVLRRDTSCKSYQTK